MKKYISMSFSLTLHLLFFSITNSYIWSFNQDNKYFLCKKLLHAISPKLVKTSGWFLLKTKDAMVMLNYFQFTRSSSFILFSFWSVVVWNCFFFQCWYIFLASIYRFSLFSPCIHSSSQNLKFFFYFPIWVFSYLFGFCFFILFLMS